MVTGLILDADGFELLIGGQPVGPRRPLTATDVDLLRRVAAGYVDAVHTGSDDTVFLELGRELFAWLAGGTQRFGTFEVRAPASPSAAGWTVLQAPWEILADRDGFLAADGLRRFEVVRRLGSPAGAPALDEYRLGLMFMASAPRGQHELDFEAEESAILTAVGDTRLDLVVEDTGDPEQLGQRWADLGGLPVLHLSCHGVNNWQTAPDKPGVPVLMMENETGDERPVTAAELVQRLSVMPRLMFVSACLTATAADADGYLPPGPEHRSTGTAVDVAGAADVVPVAHSLSTGLITAGVPAVIGWDGSVTDGAATLFAQHLYKQLGLRLDLPTAVGDARRELLACEKQQLRANWHLARIWLGPTGGGPVVAGTSKRQTLSALHGTKTFLDLKRHHVPVATAEMFVGRRREMRQALRVLRDNERAGVLLHGQGRLGKSSLAARLADRFSDRAVAVVVNDYTAMAVLDAIALAVEDNPAARSLIESRRAEVRDQPEALRWVLVDLLSGPCRQAGKDGRRPLLLIIDDLEQILEPRPEGPHRVTAGNAPVLTAVLAAFHPDRSDSRLVLTSRFVFTLDGLQDRLALVQLAPLSEVAQRKLAARQQAVPSEELRESRAALAARAVTVSRGNPGVQDLVTLRLVYSAHVDAARAEQAVADMESYLDRGDLPSDAEVRAFVEMLALDALIEQAGPTHIALLRALTLFELPVPAPVTDLLETSTRGSLERLRGLGLADTFPDIRDQENPAAAANALAAGRLTPLTDTERADLAIAVTRPLLAAWNGPEEQQTWSSAIDLQLTRLAVLAKDPAVITLCAGDAVWALLAGPAEQALALGRQSIAVLEQHAAPVPVNLLRRAAEAARVSGDGDTAAALLHRAVELAAADDAQTDRLEHARVLSEHANLLLARGEIERAEQLLYQARDMFTAAGSAREAVVAWGGVAEIMYQRGEYDEALHIRRDIELPLYEQQGDTGAAAITWGKIARVLNHRGKFDEALRIHREKALPAFERLGDAHNAAVTWGCIADILFDRGENEEALRIRRERQLPVYERLGDARATAVTWSKIADILKERGEYDEALRIHREKALPTFERLGEIRSTAVAWGSIAGILQQRGEYDEALQILRDIELPVFERLGDVRSLAVAWGNIAGVLQQRGEYDEALRIRRDIALPAYERIGDARSAILTWDSIADIQQERGEYDEALRIQLETVLPAFERADDRNGIASCLWSIAQIHLMRQETESALPRLVRAFHILEELQRQDGIAVVGAVLGQLLMSYGRSDTAQQILEKSLQAAGKMGSAELVEQIEEQLRRIGAET